jgi:hypothetical protein
MSATVLDPAEKDIFKIVMALRQLTEGRSNATGIMTLASSAGSTTVTAPNCAAGSAVFLFPATANAAAALASTYVKTSDVSKGQFVITHANNLQTDRTFFFVCLG